jgi:hypothetical protein
MVVIDEAVNGMDVKFIDFKAVGILGWVLVRIVLAVNLVPEVVDLFPLSRVDDRHELEASVRQAVP